jgi:hypothetical protein
LFCTSIQNYNGLLHGSGTLYAPLPTDRRNPASP